MENLELTGAMRAKFWRGKRVLLTGHTGFKGAWLALWLHRLGAEVTGISLPPLTTPNLFEDAGIGAICDSYFCDIRDSAGLAELVQAAQPEIVFHLAAQPLVRGSYREPRVTIETNVEDRRPHNQDGIASVGLSHSAANRTGHSHRRLAAKPGARGEKRNRRRLSLGWPAAGHLPPVKGIRTRDSVQKE